MEVVVAMKKANKEKVLQLLDVCKKNYADFEKNVVDSEDALENIIYYLDEIRSIVKKD